MKHSILYWLCIAFWGLTAQAADSERLDSLYQKVGEAINTPLFLPCNDAMLKEAQAQKNLIFEGRAYFFNLYHACNNYNTEEAYEWFDKLSAVSLESGNTELFFMGKYMLVELYSLKGDFGLALIEAKKMYEEASAKNNSRSIDIACLAMANVYISIGQYTDALDLIQTVLGGGEQVDMSSLTYLLALNNMCYMSYDMEGAENITQSLERLAAYFRQGSSVKSQVDGVGIPLIESVSAFSLCFGYASYYISLHKPAESFQYIQKLAKMVNPSTDIYYKLMYSKLSADYYALIDNDEKALHELNDAIVLSRQVGSSSSEVFFLRKKADLLMLNDQDEEAVELYQQVVKLNRSVENESYVRQIGVFNARFKADKAEMENRQLKIKKNTLYWWVFSLMLLCVSLSVEFFVINRLKKKLRDAKQKAENSERLKSMFLANMNHEIRTPLNAIAGFSGLLIEETDPDTCAEYAEIIKDSNDLLLRLISEVLDISKIEAGTITFNYSDVSLSVLMKSIYQTLKLRIEAPVELLLDPTPAYTLHTDRDRLTQVITNFLTNAGKHTSQGFVRFGYQPRGEEVYFYVTDTGVGISEEAQREIFTRFVQGNEQKGGVGLGLALCSGFVTAMGGRIGVESKVGEGSTFWFTLPWSGVAEN